MFPYLAGVCSPLSWLPQELQEPAAPSVTRILPHPSSGQQADWLCAGPCPPSFHASIRSHLWIPG